MRGAASGNVIWSLDKAEGGILPGVTESPQPYATVIGCRARTSLIYCGLARHRMNLRTAFVSTPRARAASRGFCDTRTSPTCGRRSVSARVDLLILGFCLRDARRTGPGRCAGSYLLAPIGPTRFRTVFRATVIGFAALAILPARAGDVLRPYLLARQEGLTVDGHLRDDRHGAGARPDGGAGAAGGLRAGVRGDTGLPARLLRPIEVSAALGRGRRQSCCSVVMWVLATHPERIGALAAAAARILPGRLSGRVGQLASTFSGGFAAAREPRALFLAVLWSFPLWLAIAAEAWAVTVAFGIDMPFAGTFLLQALLVIGVAVPTPGGVGSYHEAYRIRRDDVLRRAQRPGGRRRHRRARHLLRARRAPRRPVHGPGRPELSGLKDLAGAATKADKEGAATDEVPVLRPSGR